jgi:superfamily I DNA and RNA helicase
MDESFRNPRQVIEPALNVLLGTHAANPESVKTRGFADIATLRDKNLISIENRHIRVHFSARESGTVTLSLCNDKEAEQALLASRCETLMRFDGLLPQDILVLTLRKARARQLANALATRISSNLVRCTFNEKDSLAVQPNKVTVSTIASAKGYDAPYVLLASLDDFPGDVEGRASLYVGCTRAREWLDVSGSSVTPLVREFETSLAASTGESRRGV